MPKGHFLLYNENMYKIIWIVVLLALVGGVYFISTQKQTPEEISEQKLEIEGNASDLVYFSVSSGDEVSGVLNFSGTVKNAYFFEGNIGINMLDENKKVLKRGNAMATTEWMTVEPVSFSGTIDLTGLPLGLGFIQIANDNASGLPENDKFIYIPIIIGS